MYGRFLKSWLSFTYMHYFIKFKRTNNVMCIYIPLREELKGGKNNVPKKQQEKYQLRQIFRLMGPLGRAQRYCVVVILHLKSLLSAHTYLWQPPNCTLRLRAQLARWSPKSRRITTSQTCVIFLARKAMSVATTAPIQHTPSLSSKK